MGNYLPGPLGTKAVPPWPEVRAKLLVVLDDSIVDESNAIVGVRVGIRLAGCPMRRPAGVADADDSPQWLPVEQFLEASDLADRPTPADGTVCQRRDAFRDRNKVG